MRKIILSIAALFIVFCSMSQEINRSKILIKVNVDPDSIVQEIEAYLMDSLQHEITSIDTPIMTDSIEVASVSDTITHWFFPDDIISYTVIMRHEVHFTKDNRERTVIFIHSYVSNDPTKGNFTQKKIKKHARNQAKMQVIEIKENLFKAKSWL